MLLNQFDIFECIDNEESKSATGIHILQMNISDIDETGEKFATGNTWQTIYDTNLTSFIEDNNFQIGDTEYTYLVVRIPFDKCPYKTKHLWANKSRKSEKLDHSYMHIIEIGHWLWWTTRTYKMDIMVGCGTKY